MTEARKAAQEVQDQILNTIRQSQSAVVDALQAWASTIHSVTPELPEMGIPFGDKLPRPQEMVADAYDFAERLLASQRKFAEDVLKATAPVLGTKQNGTSAKTAAK